MEERVRLMDPSRGSQIAEYGLILALVVLVAVAAVTQLGQSLSTMYTHNEPISQGQELFALLDASPATRTGLGNGDASVVAPGFPVKQPLENIQFRFNPESQYVELYIPGQATEATSVDGTYVLARNLAGILSQYGEDLSPEEYDKINMLSQSAFRLADEQKAYLELYPQLTHPYDGDEEGVNVLFFNVEEYGSGQPDVLKRYEEFAAAYQMLGDMGQLETVPPGVRDTLETNAALISQLTFYNFANPQLKHDKDRAAMENTWEPRVQQLVIEGNVDVSQITLEETPGETRQAGRNIEDEGF